MEGRTATLTVLLLAACTAGGPPPGEVPCDERDPTVTIGTGDYDWEDLHAGDELTMVHGPQGGWHMLGSVRVTSMEPIIQIHYTIETSFGARISDNTLRVQTVPEDECAGAYTGMYGYLDVSDIENGEADTPPELLADQTVTMRMDVEDEAGATGTASLDVVAVRDAMDE